MHMPHAAASRLVTGFVAVFLASTLLSAQNPQQAAADAERLVQALGLQAGAVVAEVGAGNGGLTVAVARAVGRDGRVFSNEINPARLAEIRKAAAGAALENVTVVNGGPTETNFPESCCNAIFMRDAYHHFSEPAAMNASLLRALKPGGRLAILDFGPPPDAESASPAGRASDGHHGITPATLERELKAAGFEIVSASSYGFRNFIVVARKPASECRPSATGQ
jgi:tRNA A58 N-methylase Trm61